MRMSVGWLREWVRLPASVPDLAAQLTMAGFEVEATEPAGAPFTGVVVGEVLAVRPHPAAAKLTVCEVADGSPERLTIVCGAPNVRPGLKAPLARVGARLPGGATIARATLRGVESAGMLCSARELGLGEGADGLLELLGMDVVAGPDDEVLLPSRDVQLAIGDVAEVAGAHPVPVMELT